MYRAPHRGPGSSTLLPPLLLLLPSRRPDDAQLGVSAEWAAAAAAGATAGATAALQAVAQPVSGCSRSEAERMSAEERPDSMLWWRERARRAHHSQEGHWRASRGSRVLPGPGSSAEVPGRGGGGSGSGNH